MKNYPNQASGLGRIRKTLQVFRDLNQAGQDVKDDDIVGYECAVHEIYTFRSFNYTSYTPQQMQTRIAQERGKPRNSQGAQTYARELRRTLYDLGWLNAQYQVTVEGTQLLATQVGSPQEVQLLRNALIDLRVADSSGTYISHPVIILLHLLSHSATTARAGLELALEAKDDSIAERQRVIGLYQHFRTLDATTRAAQLGVSKAQVDNAVKIFPTLAVAAGLVTQNGSAYSITAHGKAVIQTPATPFVPGPAQPTGAGNGGGGTGLGQTSGGSGPTPGTASSQVGSAGSVPPTRNPGRGRRNVTIGQKKLSTRVGQHNVNSNISGAALTPDQQDEARRKLQERTNAHQDLVQYFAAFIGDNNGDIYEDPVSYDLLWQNSADQICHVFEMKTISNDADAQIQRAVGQLHYYSFFNVPARFPGATLTKTIVVNDSIHPDLADYLTAQGIGLIHADLGQGTVTEFNNLGRELLDLLP